ncbi:MAG: glucose PTS transporter subunit IIA [Eubacteriales bacterium]|nr:glucose PTS transporter subunit IIA [Eubacteriales bacterium]
MSKKQREKGSFFAVVQQVGKSFFLPVSVLPIAGILLGLGASFTNPDTIATYHMQGFLGEGTIMNMLLTIMNQVGSTIFGNLPIIFALAIALGMAKNEKAVAVLSAGISFFVMNTTINALLKMSGKILPDGSYSSEVLSGQITNVCGIDSLQMGVFAGIIVGLVTAALHNRFYKQQLPVALSFFSGVRFVPIISVVAHIGVGILCYLIWPTVQIGIYGLGDLVLKSGYFGTFVFGFFERALIPFGLHHVFYLPFWQTSLGGTMEVAGTLVEGAQNIFFAQLADPATTKFSVEACRFMTGKYPFMMAGLPGAALAMYHCSKPENRKIVGGLLFSAALTSFLTGITEPIEFTFLFIAPGLFILHCGLAGLAFVIMHILNICIGTTFSCGLIDFTLYGILQGQEKSNWLMMLPVFAVYAVMYYFVFKIIILKFNLPTPGRDDNADNIKLYTKADFQAKKQASKNGEPNDPVSYTILKGLGGVKNVQNIDCCATRLRITVEDGSKVSDDILKQSGAKGIVRKGNGIQIIYGPQVTVIKSNFEEYVEYFKAAGTDPSQGEEQAAAPSGTTTISGHGKVVAPVNGKVLPMKESRDEAFAGCTMGDGVVIIPEDGIVKAPADGIITVLTEPTFHAVGIETKTGLNILLHLGIDTVQMEGRGFRAHVTVGEQVKAGDTLITMNLEEIKKAGKLADVMVVLLDSDSISDLKLHSGTNAVAGQTVVAEY